MEALPQTFTQLEQRFNSHCGCG